jgi:hypothetical protein
LLVRRIACLRSCQNGEAIVAPLTLPLNPQAVEKAKLSRLRAREVALLAAADPVSATNPPALATVAVKIAAPVRINVWRDMRLAMSQTPQP